MVDQRQATVVQLSQKHGYVGFNTTPLSANDIKRFTRKLQGEIDQRLAGIESFKVCSVRESCCFGTCPTRFAILVKSPREGRRDH